MVQHKEQLMDEKDPLLTVIAPTLYLLPKMRPIGQIKGRSRENLGLLIPTKVPSGDLARLSTLAVRQITVKYSIDERALKMYHNKTKDHSYERNHLKQTSRTNNGHKE